MKAFIPGGVTSCLLLVAAMAGWEDVTGLPGLVLLSVAWSAGILWASGTSPVDATGLSAGLHGLVAELDAQHKTTVRDACADVGRARSVIREAAEGLNSDFRCIVNEAGGPPGSVDKAVRYLQFEDIATQLLSAAEARLQYLDELESLMLRSQEVMARHDSSAFRKLEAEMEKITSVRPKLSRRVSQDSMSGGDIELF